MAAPPKHPIDRPVLPALMLVFLVLAAVLSRVSDADDPSGSFGMLLALGLFLAVFAVYWLGWLLRGHEMWREARRTDADRRAAAVGSGASEQGMRLPSAATQAHLPLPRPEHAPVRGDRPLR